MIRNGFLIFLKNLTKNYKIGLYKKNSSCKIKIVTIEFNPWGFSSAGRASALHAEGQEFESPNLHHFEQIELFEMISIEPSGSFLIPLIHVVVYQGF